MNSSSSIAPGLSIVASLITFIISIGVALFISYCLMVIAKKLGVENAWLAFIPIANFYIMVQCAGKPVWWILLFFVPFINIIIGIIIWMGIAERRGKPSWWGILLLVPFGAFFVPAYLAFSE